MQHQDKPKQHQEKRTNIYMGSDSMARLPIDSFAKQTQSKIKPDNSVTCSDKNSWEHSSIQKIKNQREFADEQENIDTPQSPSQKQLAEKQQRPKKDKMKSLATNEDRLYEFSSNSGDETHEEDDEEAIQKHHEQNTMEDPKARQR